MVEIDGFYSGGGGQILRTACSLSAITKKPCRIFNIRKGREKPGLMTQHLLEIQAISRLCSGKLEGDFLGSEEIEFSPGEIQTQDLNIKIETAGSIALILQSLIIPCLKALHPVKINFEGGATDTFFSPTIDYFQYVFLKILEKMGIKVDVKILKRGYYPEGGAKAEAIIYPSEIKTLNLTERGEVLKIDAISGASNALKEKKVAERQITGVKEILGKLKLPLQEKIEYYETASPGSQICLIADFKNTLIGVDNLGKFGKRAEDIGKETALELLKTADSETCLDKYLADQILPYLAIVNGKSSVSAFEITNHIETNIWVIEKFLRGHFKTKGNAITWYPKP